MMMKMLNMIMIMVMILMLDDDKDQKSTMNLWSKYTPFKYYYLVKKGPKQPGRGRPPPPLNRQCPFKNVFFFFIWTPSLCASALSKGTLGLLANAPSPSDSLLPASDLANQMVAHGLSAAAYFRSCTLLLCHSNSAVRFKCI